MDIELSTGRPRSVAISRVVRENIRDVTLFFRRQPDSPTAAPGQFFMVWVPDVDEIPLSASWSDDEHIGLTVRPVGEATQRLVRMRPGDYIGIRGPFGRSFSVTGDAAIVVGGGVGMAPLRPLVYALLASLKQVTVLIAARTRDELLFHDEMLRIAESDSRLRTQVATDDGSLGFHGLATDCLTALLEQQTADVIYACGPERMMYEVYRIALRHEIPIQLSLERYMKCGCGLCGSCALDPTGHLVCLDGPVFTGSTLASIVEFGKYSRDATGARIDEIR